MKIMTATSHADILNEELCRFLEPHNGTMDVSLYPGEHADFSSAQIGKIDVIKDYSSPLRHSSRDYEAVIIHDIFHLHEMPFKLLQLIYRSMENSAELIVLQSKGTAVAQNIETLLENAEFRTPNTIDDLVEGNDVIVAKKMHMWGNGL
jgi:hypothetical protein